MEKASKLWTRLIKLQPATSNNWKMGR